MKEPSKVARLIAIIAARNAVRAAFSSPPLLPVNLMLFSRTVPFLCNSNRTVNIILLAGQPGDTLQYDRIAL